MKAMMYLDYTVMKRSTVSMVVIALIVGLFMSLMMDNVLILSPMFTFMVPFFITINLLAYDELRGWESFRLTLPLTRRQVILGRYVGAAVLTLACLVVGTVLLMLLALVINAFPSLPFGEQLREQAASLDWQVIVLTGAASFLITLVFILIAFPLTARFGMTQGVRVIPLVIVFIGFFGVSAINASGFLGGQPIGDTILSWLSQPQGVEALGVAAILAVAALYALSYFLAARFYAKREL